MPSPRASRSLSTPAALGGADGAGEGDSAQRRAREAEELLREALRRQSERPQPPDRGLPASSTHRCDRHPDESCVAHAVGNLCQSFLLSYGVRVGVGILLRAFKLARRHSYSSLLDLKQLVSEKDLIVREEACRIGLLFGGFTGSYHALRCLLRRMRKKERPSNAVLAGMVAGLSVLALDDSSRRRTLALYLLARLSQCAYNSAKSNNKFHFWGSQWGHGDSLLFALACSQVMYAFVMRPESLPKAYQDFIQKTGPVAEPVYKAVRECCRGGPVDVVSLSAFLSRRKEFGSIKLEQYPSIIPCSIIHPGTNSCLVQNVNAVSATFRKTFPLYFSLTFVPFVVLHLQRWTSLSHLCSFFSKIFTLSTYVFCAFCLVDVVNANRNYTANRFMQSPALTCWNAVKAAIRSTTFISAFVGIFQAAICFHRNVSSKDHKLVYWLAGGMAGASVLFEKKNRRAELALYVLPRAGDSLWNILVNRRLLPNVKNAEVALFCLCMGGIMYYLEYEPDTMAPFLRGLIRRFLASRISNPDPPSSQETMYPYIQPDGSLGNESESKEKLDKGTAATGEKYNLEAIPGL